MAKKQTLNIRKEVNAFLTKNDMPNYRLAEYAGVGRATVDRARNGMVTLSSAKKIRAAMQTMKAVDNGLIECVPQMKQPNIGMIEKMLKDKGYEKPDVFFEQCLGRSKRYWDNIKNSPQNFMGKTVAFALAAFLGVEEDDLFIPESTTTQINTDPDYNVTIIRLLEENNRMLHAIINEFEIGKEKR